jgi:SAM-dependent methyltransferase
VQSLPAPILRKTLYSDEGSRQWPRYNHGTTQWREWSGFMTISGTAIIQNGLETGERDEGAAGGSFVLNPAERLFIEKTLLQMYPYLQRRELVPWKWLNGPLIPDFIAAHTDPRLRRIVEIGCGDGVLSNVLSLLFPNIEIIGIDSDREKIAYARSTIGYRRNIKFICANATILAEIPCDRIIYNRCLSRVGNVYAFKKLIMKTSQWLVDEGDLLIKESPWAIGTKLSLMKELFPQLWQKRSIEACVRTLLAEIGYPNPTIYNSPGLLGIPSEIAYRMSRGLILTDLMSKPGQERAGEWKDWTDASNDSLVTFLFSNAQADFTRELV